MNKLLEWNFSQAFVFLKALTSAQNLHCRTIIFEERFPITASAMKYDHNLIIIIKSAESFEVYFWEISHIFERYEVVAGRWIEIKICHYYVI